MKISRRIFSRSSSLLLRAHCFSLLPAAAQAAEAGRATYLVYVGTYTTKQESKGIYAYRFDAATGQLTFDWAGGGIDDPSFVAVHPNGKYLYAVNEVGDFNGQKSGAISAFAIDQKSWKAETS